MVHFLARHDLVAQNQVLDLGVDAPGKIFGGARFGFSFSQGVGHRISLHKKVYAMPRNLSDWFFVVNEGRLNLQKAVKMISAISVFTVAAQGAKNHRGERWRQRFIILINYGFPYLRRYCGTDKTKGDRFAA
jgi:hypothetical protein